MNAMLKRYFSLGFASPEAGQTEFREVGGSERPMSSVAEICAQPQSTPSPNGFQTFSGTVVRSGQRFALLESDGMVYPLDSTGRAWSFEGEDVRVTGSLDSATRTIHIVAIESEMT